MDEDKTLKTIRILILEVLFWRIAGFILIALLLGQCST